MPKTVFIYCLKCPTTGDVRYIGQTNDLKRRLNAHIKTSSKEKNHLGNWLRSLKGEKPVMVILHEVAEGEAWQEEEKRYICFARGMGMDLVNSTDGGEGSPGNIVSSETRVKISAYQKGRPKSPEWREAMSARQKGVPKGPLSPKTCAAMSAAKKGVPHSPERCAARKGVPRGPFSPEHRAALRVPKSPEGRANMRGPKSPEHRAALSKAAKTSWARRKKDSISPA